MSTGKGFALTGLLSKPGGASLLVNESPGEAGSVVVDDILFTASAGGGVTATLSLTDAADAVAATASAQVGVSLAITDAADALAGAAGVLVQPSLTMTDASDTLASTATVTSSGVTCTLYLTDAQDTAASTAAVQIAASLSATDAQDSAAAAAGVTVSVVVSLTDAADTAAAAAGVQVLVGLGLTDSADSLSSTATVDQPAGGVFCSLDLQDGDDLLDASCSPAPQSLGGRDKRDWRKFDVPTRRVQVQADLQDKDDTVVAAAQVAQLCTLDAYLLDDDDLLQADALLSWPEVGLILNRIARQPALDLVRALELA